MPIRRSVKLSDSAGAGEPAAGTVPYRVTESGLEVYLVRMSNDDGWIIPKGKIEPGETAREAAIRETREEAGLVGATSANSIGTYVHLRQAADPQALQVFLLQVEGVAPGKPERDGEWVTVADALTALEDGRPRAAAKSLQLAVTNAADLLQRKRA